MSLLPSLQTYSAPGVPLYAAAGDAPTNDPNIQVSTIAINNSGAGLSFTTQQGLISAVSSLAISGTNLDLRVSTITNSASGNSIITVSETVVIGPQPSIPTGSGALSLTTGPTASQSNLWQFVAEGDLPVPANAGLFTFTRLSGGSSFPVYQVDSNGDMTMLDPGAKFTSPQLSTIDIQAGTVNGSPLNAPSRTLLGSYSGGTTGSNVQGFLTSGGSSNIAVTSNAVMCLEGTINVETAVAGGDFGFSVVLNNGAQDVTILNGNANAFKTGSGALAQVSLPFNTTFIAQGANVQVYVDTGSGAGAGDTVTGTLATPTLIRIR